jgi:hypothetical protein
MVTAIYGLELAVAREVDMDVETRVLASATHITGDNSC